jgi:putative NADPH-quinone reductase
MKKILVILGHPRSDSLSHALGRAYAGGASQTAEVRIVELCQLEFALTYPTRTAYDNKVQGTLEPDLQKAQADLHWADHLVFAYPQWWGGVPALLKGFIERVFLPGFAFKYRKDSPWQDPLLKGKTARLLVTMDAPGWYNRWVYRNAVHTAMLYPTLHFCGIKPVRITEFNLVRRATPVVIQKWMNQTRQLGRREAAQGHPTALWSRKAV